MHVLIWPRSWRDVYTIRGAYSAWRWARQHDWRIPTALALACYGWWQVYLFISLTLLLVRSDSTLIARGLTAGGKLDYSFAYYVRLLNYVLLIPEIVLGLIIVSGLAIIVLEVFHCEQRTLVLRIIRFMHILLLGMLLVSLAGVNVFMDSTIGIGPHFQSLLPWLLLSALYLILNWQQKSVSAFGRWSRVNFPLVHLTLLALTAYFWLVGTVGNVTGCIK